MPPRNRANQSQTQTQPQTKGFTVKAKVFELQSQSKLAAFVTFTFGFNGKDLFVVKDSKLIDGNKGYFLAMPSKKNPEGEFQDLAFPLSKDFREQLQTLAMEAWDKDIIAELVLSPNF